jgi:voltage-gated potassium channel
VGRFNLLERRVTRFLSEPPSVRNAAGAVVTATALVVVVSGVLIRLLDANEFPNVWLGMWWALQTVTTVGYGDVTPKDVVGRIVGAAVMLEGIAFVAIVTAAITSSFVARATRRGQAAQMRDEATDRERIEARFDELDRKLDRIETRLRRLRDA